MSAKQTVLVVVSIALATVASFWWLRTNFERIPVEVDVGYRGEARYNELLGVQGLFDSFDAPVRFVGSRRGLPPTDGTLVLLDRAQDRPGERLSEVAPWVLKGGHAVVLARKDSEDPLISMRQVKVQAVKSHKVSAKASLVPGETLDVEFRPSLTLSYDAAEPLARVGSDSGWYVLAFGHGSGRVTVLSDYRFMVNRDIGRADNAAFLWRLTHLDRNGEVWIVTGDSRPSPWQPIFARGWPLAASLAALVLGIMWSVSRRFGPLLPAPGRERPRLLDHIAASGAFYWREGVGGVLLDAVRDSVLRTIEYRRPGWLGSGDRDERIASLSGLPRERITHAFGFSEPGDPRSFTEAIATLETIRKRL